MKSLNATIIGLITGTAMILASLGIYYNRGTLENGWQYLIYAMYVGGIVWSLIRLTANSDQPLSFKNYFSQGFKCYIVVTFMMVAFTWTFIKMNPSLATEMATNYRADLVKNGNNTAAEIDKMVANAKEYFAVMITSAFIFGYLAIGTVVTLIGSMLFSRNRKNQ